MSNQPSWLPDLVFLQDYNGDWEAYINAVYENFKSDFLDNIIYFRGMRISVKKEPMLQEKEAGFWHITSEGEKEEERTPDFRRCERIRWIRAIIENSQEPIVKVWENERNGKKRICLWLEEHKYLVILEKREKYIVLWTAYLVTRKHTEVKLRKEYNEYTTKQQVPPSS